MDIVPSPVHAMETMSITNVDMQVKKNSEKHRTSRYQYPGLVVRRGESFSIVVTVDNTLPHGKFHNHENFQSIATNYHMCASTAWFIFDLFVSPLLWAGVLRIGAIFKVLVLDKFVIR